MKKKYIAFFLCVVMSTSLLSGCSTASSTPNEGTIYGKVTEVDEDNDNLTITVGTMDDEGALTLTEESKEITVTDDTEITSQKMGGGMPENMGSQDGQVPDKPQGDSANGNTQDGQAPDKPQGDDTNGDTQDGQAPDMPSQQISLSDIEEDDTISVTFDSDGEVESIVVMDENMGSMNGSGSSDIAYNALKEYTEDASLTDETVSSTGTDEEALLVSGDCEVSLSNLTVNRDSEDSTGGDDSSFYGVGAAILGTNGTTVIKDSTITTDADGGAGVFSYGDSIINVSDTTISTNKGTSGGIHVAGGGTLNASDLTITTNGESSAAIRSDRGGGTMNVTGGSYTSNGTGSPAIYSTADITVQDADLEATNSEAICIEGLNSVKLTNCDLTGNMPESEQNDCTWNVILYQSMSGDAEEGNATFEMEGGSLTAKSGGMFYTTNTESTFVLTDVDITYSDSNDFFLKCTGNANARGWGQTGSNGAQCTFTASKQEMKGDIIWDTISTLDFAMSDSSTLTGAVINDESNAGDGGDGYCDLTIGNGCTWIVTADSTLTSLTCEGTIIDADGNTVTIKDTDGNVLVEGTSNLTIEVETYHK